MRSTLRLKTHFKIFLRFWRLYVDLIRFESPRVKFLFFLTSGIVFYLIRYTRTVKWSFHYFISVLSVNLLDLICCKFLSVRCGSIQIGYLEPIDCWGVTSYPMEMGACPLWGSAPWAKFPGIFQIIFQIGAPSRGWRLSYKKSLIRPFEVFCLNWMEL